MVCGPSASDPMCKACAFTSCKAEHCACAADVGCGAAVEDFYRCLMNGRDISACAAEFVSDMTKSDAGADLANDLAACMDTANCADKCVVKEGGAG
jgi:hypothetical protein